MSEFKFGDRVRLKNKTREWFEECDTGAGMLTEMFKFVGQVHIVKSCPRERNYLLENPNGDQYWYSPNWIEPAVKFKGNK